MTDHVMHLCPKKDSSEFQHVYGWPHKEIPLNKRRHDNCPYCDAPTNGMAAVDGADVQLLAANPRAKGYKGSGAANKDQTSALMQEIKQLRKEIAAVKNGGSQ